MSSVSRPLQMFQDTHPEPGFHTEPPKVRRVEPRDQNSRQFGSDDASPVVVLTAEEFHNSAQTISTSFLFSAFFSMLLMLQRWSLGEDNQNLIQDVFFNWL